MTAIKTRTHNEIVVDSLKYYMDYLKEGKYRKIDIYKDAPFEFVIDKSKDQVLNYPVGIRFLNANEFEVFTTFESSSALAQKYDDKTKSRIKVPSGIYTKTYRSGDTITLPFLNGIVKVKSIQNIIPKGEYFIKFSNFDGVVNRYKRSVMINTVGSSSGSILSLQLAGNNKAKIVDYLKCYFCNS